MQGERVSALPNPIVGRAIRGDEVSRDFRLRQQKTLRYKEGRRFPLGCSLRATSAFAIHLAREGQVGMGVDPFLNVVFVIDGESRLSNTQPAFQNQFGGNLIDRLFGFVAFHLAVAACLGDDLFSLKRSEAFVHQLDRAVEAAMNLVGETPGAAAHLVFAVIHAGNNGCRVPKTLLQHPGAGLDSACQDGI